MPFVKTNGISIYYDSVGQGPPLCLINGYRLGSDAWPPDFIARLATRCSVIAFDNRGTGRSDKPDDGYEFANQARDVVGLLDGMGLHRVNLLGFSMGGAIAQEVAIRFGDRISRLILFGHILRRYLGGAGFQHRFQPPAGDAGHLARSGRAAGLAGDLFRVLPRVAP